MTHRPIHLIAGVQSEYTALAIERGVELIALCGTVWVPTDRYDPATITIDDARICEDCRAQYLRDEGLQHAPVI